MSSIQGALFALINVSQAAYQAIEIILLVCMVICAIFAILVVIFQPGNSDGLSVISGQKADTFFGKDSGNSLEKKLKKLTIIALCVIVAFSILFFLVSAEILIGVGPVIS